MVTITKKIREIAGSLLKKERVDFIIGFREGSLPMMSEPFLARTSSDIQNLTWNSACRMNLANYLVNRKEKIGIVAKGCDSRSIANLIVEGKVQRDQLVIIGVPCTGMLDQRKARELYDVDITSVTEKNGVIRIDGEKGPLEVKKADLLRSNCLICKYPNPVVYDELATDPLEAAVEDDVFEDVISLEGVSSEEKTDIFDSTYASCVRCYACRNACPMCYCPTCFVDESNPQWLGKGNDLTDIKTFHILRAFHLAGRCVDCGACESACPQDIPVRTLNRKLMKDCFEFYNWEAGLNLEQRPPLDTYKPNDPETFIK